MKERKKEGRKEREEGWRNGGRGRDGEGGGGMGREGGVKEEEKGSGKRVREGGIKKSFCNL